MSLKNEKGRILDQHEDIDIRDFERLEAVFKHYGKAIDLVLHTAAQPSHDWAAKEPLTDFTINANGTLKPTRTNPNTLSGGCFYLHQHQQSLWRYA